MALPVLGGGWHLPQYRREDQQRERALALQERDRKRALSMELPLQIANMLKDAVTSGFEIKQSLDTPASRQAAAIEKLRAAAGKQQWEQDKFTAKEGGYAGVPTMERAAGELMAQQPGAFRRGIEDETVGIGARQSALTREPSAPLQPPTAGASFQRQAPGRRPAETDQYGTGMSVFGLPERVSERRVALGEQPASGRLGEPAFGATSRPLDRERRVTVESSAAEAPAHRRVRESLETARATAPPYDAALDEISNRVRAEKGLGIQKTHADIANIGSQMADREVDNTRQLLEDQRKRAAEGRQQMAEFGKNANAAVAMLGQGTRSYPFWRAQREQRTFHGAPITPQNAPPDVQGALRLGQKLGQDVEVWVPVDLNDSERAALERVAREARLRGAGRVGGAISPADVGATAFPVNIHNPGLRIKGFLDKGDQRTSLTPQNASAFAARLGTLYPTEGVEVDGVLVTPAAVGTMLEQFAAGDAASGQQAARALEIGNAQVARQMREVGEGGAARREAELAAGVGTARAAVSQAEADVKRITSAQKDEQKRTEQATSAAVALGPRLKEIDVQGRALAAAKRAFEPYPLGGFRVRVPGGSPGGVQVGTHDVTALLRGETPPAPEFADPAEWRSALNIVRQRAIAPAMEEQRRTWINTLQQIKRKLPDRSPLEFLRSIPGNEGLTPPAGLPPELSQARDDRRINELAQLRDWVAAKPGLDPAAMQRLFLRIGMDRGLIRHDEATAAMQGLV